METFRKLAMFKNKQYEKRHSSIKLPIRSIPGHE